MNAVRVLAVVRAEVELPSGMPIDMTSSVLRPSDWTQKRGRRVVVYR